MDIDQGREGHVTIVNDRSCLEWRAQSYPELLLSDLVSSGKEKEDARHRGRGVRCRLQQSPGDRTEVRFLWEGPC